MYKSYRVFLIIVFVYLTGCAGNSSVRLHPQLQQELININSVAIVPPEVSVEEQAVDGENQRLKEREDEILGEILTIANEQLAEKGFRVVSYDFNNEISRNEDFAYTVNQVKEAYGEARKILYVDQDRAENEEQALTANVGSVINAVSQKTGADSLLLINYSGIKKSGGSVAKDITVGVIIGLLTGYVPVSAMEASYVEVALIDGRTGDVLWTNFSHGQYINSIILSRALQEMPDKSQKVASNQVR